MATITGDAVFDAITGFDDGGSGLTLVSNGTTDTATTVVNANGSITIANGFRFTSNRLDINTGRGTGNADNFAWEQDAGSQTVLTLDTPSQLQDIIEGDVSLRGQLVRAGTGGQPYIFGDPGNPTGNITTGNGSVAANYLWSMTNDEPLTIIGTQANITLHLANLDPFNSSLSVLSVGNSTLQSPAVNSIFGRTPSDTADTQAVDGSLTASWGYADRFIHQLSPAGNGQIGQANYLTAYALRTHYNFAPMLATTTTDYTSGTPTVSNRRQMLQTNHNVQAWLVRPLNGTDPLESTDLIPIGYHSGNFPNRAAGRPDNEIRVIIPHRPGFRDTTGALVADDVKVFYENRSGESSLEVRNTPASFGPTTIPTVLTGNELTVSNSTTNGVWVIDSINTFTNRTTAALRTPLSQGNQVAGMNNDRTYIVRSFRYGYQYQHNLGFGSVMISDVAATQDFIAATADLQPFLNGRAAGDNFGGGLTDWANFFPAIRADFYNGTPEGAFPLTGNGNTITFPGNLSLTTSSVAHTYAGNDVSIRVAVGSSNVLTGDITTFNVVGTADMAGTNIPSGITLDGGTWTDFSGNLDATLLNNPTINIGTRTNLTTWTTTGGATITIPSGTRTVDVTQAQMDAWTAGTGVTFNVAAAVVTYPINVNIPAGANGVVIRKVVGTSSFDRHTITNGALDTPITGVPSDNGDRIIITYKLISSLGQNGNVYRMNTVDVTGNPGAPINVEPLEVPRFFVQNSSTRANAVLTFAASSATTIIGSWSDGTTSDGTLGGSDTQGAIILAANSEDYLTWFVANNYLEDYIDYTPAGTLLNGEVDGLTPAANTGVVFANTTPTNQSFISNSGGFLTRVLGSSNLFTGTGARQVISLDEGEASLTTVNNAIRGTITGADLATGQDVEDLKENQRSVALLNPNLPNPSTNS